MFLMIKQIFDAIDDSFVVIVFYFIKYFLDILIGKVEIQVLTVKLLCGIELRIEITFK